jgi:tetratricopeptide (TPR) repeat protein
MNDMTQVWLVIGLMVVLVIAAFVYRIYFKKSPVTTTSKASFNPNLYPNEAFQISYKKFVPPDTAVKLAPVLQGRNAYYQGRFDEAVNLLTQEINAHINDVPVPDTSIYALDYRARVYRSTGRLQEALADYAEALRRIKDVTKPSDWTSVYFYAGCANLAANGPQAALEIFNALVQNLRQDKAGNVFYCLAPNGSQVDRERAREDLNKAIGSESKERILYYCRALAECSLSDWDNALDDCEEGLTLSGVDVDAEPLPKQGGRTTAVIPSKDRLEAALRIQRNRMADERHTAEFSAQRIHLHDSDHMEPELDYAEVAVNHVMVYDIDGIQYSETLAGKSDMVISRQLIRDGWEFTGTGGAGSADDRVTLHYFKRPKAMQQKNS